jgi:hypothetical protein
MLCGIEIRDNVFYKVTRAAFIGGGRDCVVENNIFVDCDPAVHVDARALGWAADTVPTTMMERLQAMPYRQPPWSTRYPKLVGILDDEPAAPKGNVIARNICWGGPSTLRQAQDRPETGRGATGSGSPPAAAAGPSRAASRGGKWDEVENLARPLTTFEANLLDRDPRFVDPAHLNFQLRDDSPAYALGFKRIPIEQIGPRKDR